MTERRKLSDIGLLSLLIVHQPTLRDAIGVVAEYRNRINSTLTLQLDPYYQVPLWPDSVSLAALQARALLDAGKLTEREMAEVVARSRRAARANPLAQLAGEPDVDELLREPRFVSPLRRHDCAPVTDGASAMLIASGDTARRLCKRPAWIRGIDHRMESGVLGARDLTARVGELVPRARRDGDAGERWGARMGLAPRARRRAAPRRERRVSRGRFRDHRHRGARLARGQHRRALHRAGGQVHGRRARLENQARCGRESLGLARPRENPDRLIAALRHLADQGVRGRDAQGGAPGGGLQHRRHLRVQ